MLAKLVDVADDATPFARQKLRDCIGKFRPGQPVGGMGGDRSQAAREFVFALGAAFEYL